MNQQKSKQTRILAIALSTRGFGFCAMEDQAILEDGYKSARGNKNLNSLAKIERLMKQFLPGVLILPDVDAKGCRRASRIIALHQKIVELAKFRKCKVAVISAKTLRNSLLGNPKGTKHEMAEIIAQKFPAELAAKLPPKRRAQDSEDGRTDIFDAAALAVVFRMKNS